MKFKYGIDSALWSVHSRVQEEVKSKLTYIDTNRSNKDIMAEVIANAVKAGFEELFRQEYSDADLERDLQLRP